MEKIATEKVQILTAKKELTFCHCDNNALLYQAETGSELEGAGRFRKYSLQVPIYVGSHKSGRTVSYEYHRNQNNCNELCVHPVV